MEAAKTLKMLSVCHASVLNFNQFKVITFILTKKTPTTTKSQNKKKKKKKKKDVGFVTKLVGSLSPVHGVVGFGSIVIQNLLVYSQCVGPNLISCGVMMYKEM